MHKIPGGEQVDTKLVKYIENDIFPLYNENEEGHGINHIETHYLIKKNFLKELKK